MALATEPAPEKAFRSECPLNFAVEMLCDRWSLLILRDMMFWGKRSYSEFMRSDEGIATNVLADRLEDLLQKGLITKTPDEGDRRRDVFSLTPAGLDLAPIMVELIRWSAKNEIWQQLATEGIPEHKEFVERTLLSKNRTKLAKEVRRTVRRGGHVFETAPRSKK